MWGYAPAFQPSRRFFTSRQTAVCARPAQGKITSFLGKPHKKRAIVWLTFADQSHSVRLRALGGGRLAIIARIMGTSLRVVQFVERHHHAGLGTVLRWGKLQVRCHRQTRFCQLAMKANIANHADKAVIAIAPVFQNGAPSPRITRCRWRTHRGSPAKRPSVRQSCHLDQSERCRSPHSRRYLAKSGESTARGLHWLNIKS